MSKGEDTASIKSAISELEQASQAFSKVLYERTQAAPDASAAAAGGDSAPSGADDDTIDAEFEVKDS